MDEARAASEEEGRAVGASLDRNSAIAPSRPAPDLSRSAYGHVGGQIAALVQRLGLEPLRPRVMQAYEDVCRGSLAFPLGSRPPAYSRINEDGTPFQFAVTVGPLHRSLQLLGEPGAPGLSGAERYRESRACIATVAGRLQLSTALAAVADLLDRLAPSRDPALLADPAGAFWIGLGFSAARAPRLKIYTNAAWGREPDRWARLGRFASYFGADAPWQALASWPDLDMQPLGTAVTLGADAQPYGRIYLSATGKRSAYFEELARSVGADAFAQVLQEYAQCVLGDDYPYPTRSAVCSFGMGGGPGLDFKLEFCAHCLYASDVEAASRLHSWFAAAGLDPAGYVEALDVLSQGRLSNRAPDLHRFVGAGLKQGTPYFSVYLKPSLVAADGL
jgi:hypothetical protein